MPLIETRPFTIHPELYAWPSYRTSLERTYLLYLAAIVGISFILILAMRISPAIAILLAIGIVGAAVLLSFTRYKMALHRPAARQVLRDSVVRLTDDELRQDYSDGSHLAFKLFAVTTFRDTGEFYFINATPKNRIVVAKTAFESPEQSHEFASIIRQLVKKA